MTQKALETIFVRNEFYRKNFYWLASLSAMLSVLTILHIYVVLTYKALDTKPVYFATMADGTLLPIKTLNQPSITDEELLSWVSRAAVKAYSISFANYIQDIAYTRQYFTKTGFVKFKKALMLSNNMNSLLFNKQTMYARIPDGAAAKITRRGILNGVYGWAVELPLVVHYEGSTQTPIHQKIKLTMLITRVSNLEEKAGVSIEDFIAEDMA